MELLEDLQSNWLNLNRIAMDHTTYDDRRIMLDIAARRIAELEKITKWDKAYESGTDPYIMQIIRDEPANFAFEYICKLADPSEVERLARWVRVKLKRIAELEAVLEKIVTTRKWHSNAQRVNEEEAAAASGQLIKLMDNDAVEVLGNPSS